MIIIYCIIVIIVLIAFLIFIRLERKTYENIKKEKEKILSDFEDLQRRKNQLIETINSSKQLNEKAREVQALLSKYLNVTYDETASIGKRYRRQDAIGTPFCVTVDFETENDGCVTVWDRDTMEQIRLPISELVKYLTEKTFY